MSKSAQTDLEAIIRIVIHNIYMNDHVHSALQSIEEEMSYVAIDIVSLPFFACNVGVEVSILGVSASEEWPVHVCRIEA